MSTIIKNASNNIFDEAIKRPDKAFQHAEIDPEALCMK